MHDPTPRPTGKYLALTAALLGWLFDGLEMGLFPQVAGAALNDLGVSDKADIGRWFSIITATFLVGAATGGVLFGWLGDRLGRVRAMALSVITYAVFSGAGGLATEPWHLAVLRFVAALGMGGEWSLGVALVMEVWPNRSRGFMAGLIGTAANVGFMSVGIIGLGLTAVLGGLQTTLSNLGLSESTVEWLTRNNGWRILMLLGITPALLTFFIRLWVPESAKWEEEQKRGGTSHWAGRDLFAVLVGATVAGGIISLWAVELSFVVQILGTLVGLAIVLAGYLYPTVRYLQRAESPGIIQQSGKAEDRSLSLPALTATGTIWTPTLRRMLLAACLSGVPLLATWGSVQLIPTWADSLPGYENGKYYTQIYSALGACFGTIGGALLGDWVGRRISYVILCLASLGIVQAFFAVNTEVNALFLIMVFFVGGLSASFYGWLPLYLPELFPTKVRATGQGFGFNFGRVLAAIGGLQMANLIGWFGTVPKACMVLCCIYLVGTVIIWLAPETHGQPLPE